MQQIPTSTTVNCQQSNPNYLRDLGKNWVLIFLSSVGQNTWWLWTITQGFPSLDPLVTCQYPPYHTISQAYSQSTRFHLSSWPIWEVSSLAKSSRENANRVASLLAFSSPYHHQANSLAEKPIGTCKSTWKKATESKQCPHAALWMYRITPLDDHLPSPYELLFGRRPKSMLPSSESSLQSQHPDKDCHQEANLRKQTKHAVFCNTKTRPKTSLQ